MRSGTGTKSGPPGVVTRATKSVIAFFAAPSFQDGSGSGACATAASGVSAVSNRTSAGPIVRRRKRAIFRVLSTAMRLLTRTAASVRWNAVPARGAAIA